LIHIQYLLLIVTAIAQTVSAQLDKDDKNFEIWQSVITKLNRFGKTARILELKKTTAESEHGHPIALILRPKRLGQPLDIPVVSGGG